MKLRRKAPNGPTQASGVEPISAARWWVAPNMPRQDKALKPSQVAMRESGRASEILSGV